MTTTNSTTKVTMKTYWTPVYRTPSGSLFSGIVQETAREAEYAKKIDGFVAIISFDLPEIEDDKR